MLRLGRLAKLVKLLKLVRLIKFFNSDSKMLKNVKESLAVSIGTEKLFFFIMISVLCIHIMSCMWIFASEITSEPTNWIETGGYEKYPPWKKYLISFYFIVTTATTVGYGDISATNDVERFFAIAFMILG